MISLKQIKISIKKLDKNNVFLEKNSCYRIKLKTDKTVNIEIYYDDILFLEKKANRELFIYTKNKGYYYISTLEDYELDFVSLSTNNYKIEENILFSNIIDENILSLKIPVYLVLLDYNIRGEDLKILKKINNYIIFNKLNKFNVENLITILKSRIKDKKCYYYQNGKFNENESYLSYIQNYNFQEMNETEHISASFATYSKRKDIVEETIQSLIDQCDSINIYFNNYELEDLLKILQKYNKIKYVIDSRGDYRAAGKFFWANEKNIKFLCDDDIIYPKDYIFHSLKFINDTDLFSYLGNIFPENVKVYPKGKNRRKYYHFAQKCKDLILVHMGGTGVMFFQNEAMFPSFETLIEYPSYNDDLVAIECRNNGTKIYTVPKEENWLIPNPKMDFGLYYEKNDDPVLNQIVEIFKKLNPWL